MGPKKSKKDTGVDEDADKVELLNNKIHTLQKQLVTEQEKADGIRGAENELRERVMYLDKDLNNEKDKLKTITTAMTHQYKQMQKEYGDELNSLTKKIGERENDLKKSEEQITQTRKEQEECIKNKEVEISELKKRIEDMSVDFAKMLKETLEKMQERINMAQWDNDNDPQMMKRMKEMNGLS
ncbi:MAG: hypothetical protein JST59_01470 [Actinobacteria bacterium]|nr:hypothetical protein [Actinomycetota bacterium]